jgi:Uncharacterized protein conserved in bacteria
MLVNIGFGNMVSSDKMLAVVSSESAPIKRIMQDAKEKGTLIDASFGRKTKSVIVMEGGSVVLSALVPDKIADRVNTPGKEEKK